MGIFLILPPRDSGYEVTRFEVSEEGASHDRVVVIEDRLDGGVARKNLIQHATESIDLAYYAVHDGVASDLFYSLIIEAADQGVQVRLLFDGIFHNFKGKQKRTLALLTSHPNISVALYEPLNLLKPWTFNNRLHDKLIIIDQTYALIGGRNIGDKYYVREYEKAIVKDRDVLIIGEEGDETSVLHSFEAYFDSLWNHRYTKEQRSSSVLPSFVADTREEVGSISPSSMIDWNEYALPTKQVRLVTNPITRLNKEPIVWMELLGLVKDAKKSILLQSPYIIPTRRMKKEFPVVSEGVTQTFLTNSAAVSPNPFAIAGYANSRRTLNGVHEYHGEGSIHAKTYIFDSRISVVGSFNIDGRSTFLSTESVVIIDSEEVAAHLEEHIQVLQDESKLDSPLFADTPLIKRVMIMLGRLIVYPFSAML